ncbi:WD40/YVTN/BNR-like repeat-containing protein [Chitinophaga agri]|uniref:Photosynthesis system II assembly factor Ycf48/Hcf136-like domain-containing protein n=1 Tax=Chitinophaga agri TaxID=2703787 RepID=A0A6B9ZKB5_9BACT|nr:hypothetical protein [Chitinophaga agri]QHS62021.1 hypothetical protein GWR21_21150 [Chitinophaga agri]
MKWSLYIFMLILAGSLNCYAQQPNTLMPLQLHSRMLKLHVTPEEQFVITTPDGNIAMADSLNGLWHFNTPEVSITNSFNAAIFFNRDTGFVSGSFSSDHEHKIIYHTQDRGKSWSKINFGTSGWADGAWSLPNGEAWMTIGGKGIVYSKDYGFTWTLLPIYDSIQRYQTIFFNQQHEGIAGSVYNTIAYTNDNCRSWKNIPSPLDQNAYNKTDEIRRPEIDKVCIYKDILLVSEEGMIFYTKKDSIKWKPLPDYISFSTDDANSVLYFLNNAGQIIRSDEQLRPLFTIPTSAPAVDIFTRNSRLFLVTANSIIECGTDGKVREHLLQTMDTEDSKPVAIRGEETDKFYAAKGNMIFTNTNRLFAHPDKWEYAFTLPFPAYDPSAIAVNKNRIVYSTADSIYYYDLSSHQKQVTTMQALLDEFREHPIETVTFSQGVNDCFMNYSNSLIYMRKNNLFRPLLGNKKNNTIEPAAQTLDEAKITQFVSDVCLYHNRQPVMTDIGFSEADYQQSKKDIIFFRDAEHTLRNYLKFYRNNSFYFSRNNIDFNRLISTVDSVKLMDSVTLNRALRNSDGLHSYSTTWIDVALKNK